MAHIAFIVSAPRYRSAALGTYNHIGEQLAQLIAKDLPLADGVRYVSNTKSDSALSVTLQSDVVNPTAASSIWTRTGIAGAAAGDHTVTGIKTTDKLVAVVHVDDTTHASTDTTSEYTISAADTINNTGGTSSVGAHVVVVFYRPPAAILAPAS